jgi:sugar lactone lactonase YvrE
MMMTVQRVAVGSMVAALVVGLTGCSENPRAAAPAKATSGVNALKTPTLAFDLTGKYTNPDGMCIKDGELYINMNNLTAGKPSKIVKLTKDGALVDVLELPVHPKTGIVCALGMTFAQDGNLYVNDNQNFAGKGLGLSRIFRVVMKDGKAEKVEVVAQGINEANGITSFGDTLYVCDTNFGTKEVYTSGVYQFKLAELNAESPVQVNAGPKDPHCIGSFVTTGKWSVGANGIAADKEGNLFVCNFGDAVLWKLTFDADRKVKSFKPFAECAKAGVESLDGLQYDAEGNNLWTADFIGNAVVKVDAESGTVTIVAKNAPNSGAGGKLVSPSECIRFGNKVYVSNINLTFGPHKTIKEETISVIEL